MVKDQVTKLLERRKGKKARLSRVEGIEGLLMVIDGQVR